MSGTHRRGVTFVELFVCVGLAGAVFAPTLAQLSRARESANRVKCASNLKQIGMAMKMYANEANTKVPYYPRTRFVVDAAPQFSYDTSNGGSPANPFLAGQPNDVCTSIFLLLRTQDLVAEVFVCPSTGFEKDTYGTANGANALNKVSFTKPENLSYSMANPFPDQAAITDGFSWDDNLRADFAVFADMNPGTPDVKAVTASSPQSALQKANSKNHSGAGQNVIFADGHVEWKQSPFCGVFGDNIYTRSVPNSPNRAGGTSGTIVGPPAWAGDSVCLPVAVIDPPNAAQSSAKTWIFIGVGIVIVVAAVVMVILLTRKKKPAPAWGYPGNGAPPFPPQYPPPPPPAQRY